MEQLSYFRKQEEVFSRALRTKEDCDEEIEMYGELPHDGARVYAFAADYPRDSQCFGGGRKRYLTITLEPFLRAYSNSSPDERMHYELLLEDVPSKMYFDLDGALTHNKNRMDAEVVRSNFFQDFTDFLRDTVTCTEGGTLVFRPRMYDADTFLLTGITAAHSDMGRWRQWTPFSTDRCDHLLQDAVFMKSGTEKKLSLHVVFPYLILENMYHCGAMMRRFEVWLITKYGDDPQENPYYFLTDNGEHYTCVIDRGVYTRHRVMRLPWSSKSGQSRPLIPFFKRNNCSLHFLSSNETAAAASSSGSSSSSSAADIPNNDKDVIIPAPRDDVMLLSLIQHTVPLPCDASTSGTLGKFECSRNPITNSFIVISVCEAIPRNEVADMEKHKCGEWREPSSKGNRIIAFSKDTIRKLQLNDYIPVSQLRAYADDHGYDDISSRTSRATSRNAEDSATRTRKRRRRLPATSNISSFFALSKSLLDRFARSRSGGDGGGGVSSQSLLTHLQDNHFGERNAISSIKTNAYVLLCSLAEGRWWNPNADPSFYEFDEDIDLDLANGVIMFRPRALRYCELKGGEHTSNHVYFKLFLYGGANNCGGVRQYCHSAHCFGYRSLAACRTEKQKAKMKILRTRMNTLFNSRYGRRTTLLGAKSDEDFASDQFELSVRTSHVILNSIEMAKAFTEYVRLMTIPHAAASGALHENRDDLHKCLNVYTKRLRNLFVSYVPAAAATTVANATASDDSDTESDGNVVATGDDDDDMSEESMDFHDSLAFAQTCSASRARHKKRYIGMVDAKSTSLLIGAIAGIENEQVYHYTSTLFCMFRANLLGNALVYRGGSPSLWHNDCESMKHDVLSFSKMLLSVVGDGGTSTNSNSSSSSITSSDVTHGNSTCSSANELRTLRQCFTLNTAASVNRDVDVLKRVQAHVQNSLRAVFKSARANRNRFVRDENTLSDQCMKSFRRLLEFTHLSSTV